MAGHSHSHSHFHPHAHAAGKNLALAFWLNTGFALLELVGGFYINSVAVLSDALHDFGDSAALGLAWYFQRVAHRRRDAAFTFGYKRFALLGALINALILFTGSAFVFREAVLRLMDPEPASATGMIVFAVFGILVNGVALWRLQKGSSLNEKAVALHFLEDVLGWVVVLIGGVVLLFAELPWLDPVLSLGIAGFILFNVVKNLRAGFRILLQAVPSDLNEKEIERELAMLPGVASINDLHLWSLDGEYHILTVNVTPDKNYTLAEAEAIKQHIRNWLAKKKIHHITIEMERGAVSCDL